MVISSVAQIGPDSDAIVKHRDDFVFTEGGVEFLKCPWCSGHPCTNECLVTHGISSEIIEKITKY